MRHSSPQHPTGARIHLPLDRRRELLRGRFGFERRCDWCDNYTQDGLPEELAELCEGFRCTNRGACMGHVTLLPRPGATEAGEDGLVECEACGTLQQVAELRAELSGYENDLKEALCCRDGENEIHETCSTRNPTRHPARETHHALPLDRADDSPGTCGALWRPH
jgi:hypothetical protein